MIMIAYTEPTVAMSECLLPFRRFPSEVCSCSNLTLCIDEVLEIPSLVKAADVAHIPARPLAMYGHILHFPTVYDRIVFVEIMCQLVRRLQRERIAREWYLRV